MFHSLAWRLLAERRAGVQEADYRQAILADLEWALRHSTQIYGVLNACRVLAYLGGHGVLSKAEAADWHLAAFRRPTGR